MHQMGLVGVRQQAKQQQATRNSPSPRDFAAKETGKHRQEFWWEDSIVNNGKEGHSNLPAKKIK